MAIYKYEKNVDWQSVGYKPCKIDGRTPDLNTQIKVAKKSGIGQTTVGRILRNESSATADNIEAIACAFGLSVGELLSTQTNVGEPRHINSRERMLFDLFASLSR